MKAQRRTKDTTGLGYPSLGPMETGKSSKSKRMKDDKRNQSEARGMKSFKFSCNHYGKSGHKTNDCRNKPVNQKKTFTFDGYCRNCHKYGHTAYECRSQSSSLSSAKRFNVHCFTCNMFGHRSEECRFKTKVSRPLFKLVIPTKRSNQFNATCSMCGNFGHVVETCRMRKGHKNNPGPWRKTGMACFNYHKINHLPRECISGSYNRSVDKNQFSKKKEQNDLKGNKTTEEIRDEMKKTWIKKDKGKE